MQAAIQFYFILTFVVFTCIMICMMVCMMVYTNIHPQILQSARDYDASKYWELIKALLQHSDAYQRTVSRAMKQKLVDMSGELARDAFAKIEEIQNLRLKESKTTAYRQGELAYHARKKWTQMLKLYFKSVHNIDTISHTEMIKDMTTLQRLDMDIYHATENMNQMENDGEEVPFGDERRRLGTANGGRPNNPNMRRYLASADSALREKVRKQSDRIRNIYRRTSPPPIINVHEHLQFLDKNASEILLVPKNLTGKLLDYEPEFILPLII